jgi:multicomponent Na+:H+ antiporter subunit D
MAILCILGGVIPQYVTKYLVSPAVSATLNIGKYINVMMGDGFAERIMGEPVKVPNVDYTLAGYWDPKAWLILFGILLLAFTLAALAGGFGKSRVETPLDSADGSKYDVSFSGEAAEHSQVGGEDLFWGLKHNLRGYFEFMHSAHSGIVNDYALWVVSGTAILIVFMFVFIG